MARGAQPPGEMPPEDETDATGEESPPERSSTALDPPLDEESLVELIRDLVRIESENPPGEEGPCARFVRDWFRERDVDAELVSGPAADRPGVGVRVGEGDPTVVLNGHLDVVPAGDESGWRYPPYGAVVEDGRIYGRGSADMKAGLAVGMVAALAVRDAVAAGTVAGTVVFHAAAGEETGEPGTRRLLEAGYDGDYGVVLEPTDFRVATSAKGLVCYEIRVRGEPSHASRPDQGRNAVLEAHPVVDAIRAYDARLREREDPLVGRAYANITRFEAGTESNLGVLPEAATLVLDRRVLPGESIAEVRSEVEAMLDTVADEHGAETDVTEVQRYEPASVPTDCELATVLREHSGTVADASADPWGIEAATDVRNLVNDAGMEAVTWGPGSLAQAHTRDEYVEVADVTAGLDALLRTVRTLFDRH